ncbi:hypothetical protein [Streptomyces sp. NPDC058548]|uniref:hypothetical protein n=1 Tax=Streptomyces sp. NPDC058548 TaxID=3346545 RepID=UPI00365B3F44
MARIQVLELPMEHHGDDTVTTPFALVIDQATEEEAKQLRDRAADTATMLGARAVIVSTGTLEPF